MEIIKKYEKYLSTDAQDAIKTSDDLDEAAAEVFYLVAAGKGDKAKKPNLIKAVEFMMTYFEWCSDVDKHAVISSQNSDKPFNCSKCDKAFRASGNLKTLFRLKTLRVNSKLKPQ